EADFAVVTDGEKLQGEKMGLKVIIDMAKLNVPFQFNCSVTTRKRIREQPDEDRRVVWSMAESIHYYKTHKEESIKVAQKYTRGLSREILEAAYGANRGLRAPWKSNRSRMQEPSKPKRRTLSSFGLSMK